MNENACNINNEIEYKNLEPKAQKTQKKLSINRKISNGILKRKNIRSNTLREKNNSFKSSNSIKWDNKSIDEQKDYLGIKTLDQKKKLIFESINQDHVKYTERELALNIIKHLK